MGKLEKIPDNADALQLKPLALAVTALIILIIVLGIVPRYIAGKQNPLIGKDFRLSYDLRDDYIGYRHIAEAVCKDRPAVFIGDSVVWGMYVDNANTIPALLNRKAGREEFGNLAVDGLHPVAMETLVKAYGGAIRGKRVYLYWNPLWMNSPLYDLSGDGEFSINHPRLLPQLDWRMKSYRAPLADRLGALLDRAFDYRAYLHHYRVAFLGNDDFKTWIAKHPNENLFEKLSYTYDPVEKKKNANSKIAWDKAGIAKQDWQFVEPGRSRQWRSFRAVIATLKERGNRVHVVVGTLNPYMQTPASLERYKKLRAAALADLEKAGVAVIELPELPSAEYADASHPLAAGYATLADFIFTQINDKGTRK